VAPGESERMSRALDEALASRGPAFIVARVPCPRYAARREES
jgi:pyruvate/2-oxoacid:ferredoxin oxidoreductase beta subunit